jgi:glucose/arabinose dehydrogenase
MVVFRRLNIVIIMALLLATGLTAKAQNGAPNPALYQWVKFTDKMDSPDYITHAGDGSGRIFIMEQGGLIWVADKTGQLKSDPFLDLSDLVIDDMIKGGYTERGLIGLAFHPDYTKNGLFFVMYSDKGGDSVIARYKVMANNADQADPDSATIILTIKQPYDNHKAGQLAFGPDGFLYIGVGDGGNNGDPQNFSQNTKSLLGKILRIDVNADKYNIPDSNPFKGNDAYAPEIWARGLRNPWRFSFDRANGDLYIGDVGEHVWEELDYQPGSSHGGENYGWNYYEGKERFRNGAIDGDVVMPYYVYDHSVGCAVMGGYVYRGKTLPALQGTYFFGDYCTGHIYTANRTADQQWKIAQFADIGGPISSFGEDEQGELYVAGMQGHVWRLQAK